MKRTNSGFVTVSEWTYAPNGREYRYFYCSDWRVVIDKDSPVENFRSSEKWQLYGYVDNELAMVIPGCQVKAFIVSKPGEGIQGENCFSIDIWRKVNK